MRDPRFRASPPKVQEGVAGTVYETLRRIHGVVSVEELRIAVRNARPGA